MRSHFSMKKKYFYFPSQEWLSNFSLSKTTAIFVSVLETAIQLNHTMLMSLLCMPVIRETSLGIQFNILTLYFYSFRNAYYQKGAKHCQKHSRIIQILIDKNIYKCNKTCCSRVNSNLKVLLHFTFAFLEHFRKKDLLERRLTCVILRVETELTSC